MTYFQNDSFSMPKLILSRERITNLDSAIKPEIEYAVRQKNQFRLGPIAHECGEYLCGAPPAVTVCDFHLLLDTKTRRPTQTRIAKKTTSPRVLLDTVYQWLAFLL